MNSRKSSPLDYKNGQNRIGGNVVADIIIFGRQAGTKATEFAKK